MAPRSKRTELDAAWRALAGYETGEGWRTISIGLIGQCRFHAGRHFPGNEEALVVGFSSIRIPPAEHLPKGSGFLVSKVVLIDQAPNYSWVALCRQRAGNPDLFAIMSDDIVVTLEEQKIADNDRLFGIFLSRIRAWQDFMRIGREEILSPEAEVGLFGELTILNDLLGSGMPVETVINSWQGSLDGTHDFSLGTGAIEVKSTVSPSGFPAKIGSLEQLDDSLIRPLYLAAVRLELIQTGIRLPELVGAIIGQLEHFPTALAEFNSRLIHAGYLETMAGRYTRKFTTISSRLYYVKEGFPRLTYASVPMEVRSARYEIDLDLIHSENTILDYALKHLGVI